MYFWQIYEFWSNLQILVKSINGEIYVFLTKFDKTKNFGQITNFVQIYEFWTNLRTILVKHDSRKKFLTPSHYRLSS